MPAARSSEDFVARGDRKRPRFRMYLLEASRGEPAGGDKGALEEVFAHIQKEVPKDVGKPCPGSAQTPVMLDNTTPPVSMCP